MKILRLLSTNETTTDFNNNLNENLTIEPNSKVGLVNLSLELDDNNIIVTNANNTFQFSTKGLGGGDKTTIKDVTLTPNSYNYQSFIDELDFQMNRSCGGDDRRFMWQPILDEDTQTVNLQYSVASVDTAQLLQLSKNMKKVEGKYYRKTSGTDKKWSAYMYNLIPFIESSGLIAVRIIEYPDQTDPPAGTTRHPLFLTGLMKNVNEKLYSNRLKPEDLFIGIVCEETAFIGDMEGRIIYTVYLKGSKVFTSDVAVMPDDILKIYIFSGKLVCSFYRPDELEEYELYSYTYAEGENKNLIFSTSIYNLYSEFNTGLLTLGPANVLKKSITFTTNPFYEPTVEGITKITNIHNNMINNYINYASALVEAGDVEDEEEVEDYQAVAQTVRIYLDDSSKKLMGFKNNLYNRNIATGSFDAEIPLNDLYIPGSIIVEVPTLSLNSYDLKDNFNARRNILACLPALSKRGLNMMYSTDKPLMVDINNKFEQVVNLIKVRILDINDNTIKIVNKCGVTLVLDH